MDCNQPLDEIGHGSAAFEILRCHVSAGAVGGELKAHSTDRGAFQAEPQHGTDFVQVGSTIHCANERTADVVLAESFQSR